MKYCAHCGAELMDEAAICTKCGCSVDGMNSPYGGSQSENWNTLAIVGFVLSFFTSIVGLVLSILSYKQTKESGEKGKELALAGIIISSIKLALSIVVIIIYIGLFAALFSAIIESGGM